LHLLRIGLAPLLQVRLSPSPLAQLFPDDPFGLLLIGFPFLFAPVVFAHASLHLLQA
jgi:hypothetical protein